MNTQEIIEHLVANKDALQGVIAHVQTTPEGKELMTNHANAHFEQEIKPRLSKVYSDLDNDILTSLGEARPADKKTYEFIKEKMSELKTLKADGGKGKDAKVIELEAEIEKLKSGGEANSFWKKQHESAVKDFETKEADFNKQLTNLQEGQKKAAINSFLSSGKSKLEFNVEQDVVDAISQHYSAEVVKNSKLVDGKVVLHGADGNPLLNESYKPMTAEDFWKTKLGSVLKKQSAPGGRAPETGVGNIITIGEGDAKTTKLVLDKSKFSTKVEFNKEASNVLTAKGVAKDSKEWNKLLDTAYAEYEVSKLILQ